jgi:hypothetical protein
MAQVDQKRLSCILSELSNRPKGMRDRQYLREGGTASLTCYTEHGRATRREREAHRKSRRAHITLRGGRSSDFLVG